MSIIIISIGVVIGLFVVAPLIGALIFHLGNQCIQWMCYPGYVAMGLCVMALMTIFVFMAIQINTIIIRGGI